MQFFNFHHHLQHQIGILNRMPFEEIHKGLFSVGIHPKYIDENWKIQIKWLEEHSKNPNCFAIGECGLDAFSEVEYSLQEEVFQQQISLANEIKKPLIIHCVRRFSELLKFKKMAQVPMIIHSFNKKKSLADELLEKGFYLSFGSAILENVSLQSVLKEIPEEKFFLETDASEVDISEIYKKMAEIRNTSVEDIQKQIQHNLEKIKNG